MGKLYNGLMAKPTKKKRPRKPKPKPPEPDPTQAALAAIEKIIAIFWTFYNWCRPHSSLGGKTPAEAAGLTSEKMSLEQLIGLIG